MFLNLNSTLTYVFENISVKDHSSCLISTARETEGWQIEIKSYCGKMGDNENISNTRCWCKES